MSLNEAKLNELLGTMVNELGAVWNGILILLGDQFGLYKAIAKSGGLTTIELAKRTKTSERYVREWASAQAASGFVQYRPETKRFFMTPEQAAVLADEISPVLMTGGFYAAASAFADLPRITDAFRTGEGVSWGDRHSCLFCGNEKFFSPSYKSNLLSSWIPALNGVSKKLEQGARVADVGCGHAVSTLIMAEAYPNSEFVGFDIHEPSIQHARKMAEKSGLKNVRFEVATAQMFPGNDYDFVTFFDCLHDMGDPHGAMAHVRESLAPDGTCMIIEPMAADALEDNLNPVGRLYYSASTMVCVPTSLAQETGTALGAQAGEARLREVAEAGGFGRFRRAAETPFNMIMEARP
jgi:2-polyprenyl-3-methyl-5-hydroxy-6-metoxy-1,4-benzoquinol methylase